MPPLFVGIEDSNRSKSNLPGAGCLPGSAPATQQFLPPAKMQIESGHRHQKFPDP
jgi:hypothetical protein